MGSGVLRKQYTALANLAEEFGVDFVTPEGSFNQKFCALCKIMIDDLGGTFEPVKGGTFTTRKAVYLWQVAKSIGASPESRQSMTHLMLSSAKAIWDNGNDGIAPDFGGSFDWRTFQYLAHAVGGPVTDDLIQWVLSEAYDETEENYPDRSENLNVLKMGQSPALEFNGTDQALLGAWIVGTETVTNRGTAIPTVSAGRVDFTAGTVYGLEWSTGEVHPCSEVNGDTCKNATTQNVNDLTLYYGSGSLEVMRSARQNDYHYSILNGFTPAVGFDGVDDQVMTGKAPTSLTIWRIVGRFLSIGGSQQAIGSFTPTSAFAIFTSTADRFGCFLGNGSKVSIRDSDTDVHEWIVNPDGVSIDGVQTNIPHNFGTDALELAIGNWNRDGTLYPSNFECLESEIKLNGVDVDQHLIPSLTERGAMVDTVTGTTYYNKGLTDNSDPLDYTEIPALSDGSADATGGEITCPAINGHNGAITQYIQDATNPDAAKLLTRSLFSDDGVSVDYYTYGEMLTRLNYDQNIAHARRMNNKYLGVYDQLVYEEDKQLTPEEYTRNKNYLRDEVEGGSLVPAEVTAGTGIGPDSDWADNGDGKVLLVEDA